MRVYSKVFFARLLIIKQDFGKTNDHQENELSRHEIKFYLYLQASASNSYPSGQEKPKKTSVPNKQQDSRYSNIFDKYDHDGSGSLSKAEFKAVFQEYGLRWSREMDKKFDEWDSSGDGRLSITGKSHLALPIQPH